MKIMIKYQPSSYIKYDKIQQAFASFKLEGRPYAGLGIVKKQASGRCLYAKVSIIIEQVEYKKLKQSG